MVRSFKLLTSLLMSSVCLSACLFLVFIENKVAKGSSYNEGQISAERSSDKLLRVPKRRSLWKVGCFKRDSFWRNFNES